MRKPSAIVIFVFIAALPFPASAQEDMPDSQDHPQIPRIEGTYIVGYGHSLYDEGEFITGFEDRELQTVVAEGKRTRIAYLGPKTVSPLLVLRNYQTALAELGEVEEIFLCRKTDCPSNLPKIFTWSDQRRVDNVMPGSRFVFGVTSYYRDQLYWYGRVTGTNARYHVSIYSSVFTEKIIMGRSVRGLPFIHLEILEEADFEATLEIVAPEAIAKSISEKGHIALYGIHFDVDSATLKADSKTTLESIASVLRNDPALRVYVVGHTDNQGGYDYNLDLSKRRAASVVATLTEDHGISAERLVALGVGPAAPVASNTNGEGQALNRRVELVEF